MTTITLKKVPDQIYARLKKSAKTNRRSINSEAIVLLEGVLPRPKPVGALLKRIRARRESQGIYLTDRDLNAAKHEGRA